MFDCSSPPLVYICGPSSIGESPIIEGIGSGEGVGEGVGNGVTIGNGDGTDDVKGVVTGGEGVDATTGVGDDMMGGKTLLDWGGMFAILGHGKYATVGATPSEIGVRPGEGEHWGWGRYICNRYKGWDIYFKHISWSSTLHCPFLLILTR